MLGLAPVLDLTGAELVAVLLVTALGACVQGSIGFGLGLLGGPLLALVDQRFVPGPIIACGVLLTLAVVHAERRDLRFALVRWALVGRVVGSVAGAAAIAAIPERALGLLFGGVILVAVALSAAGRTVDPSTRVLLGAGALSGFMGTTVSVGGPPLALVYQRQRGPELRATMAVFLVFGATLSLVLLVAFGEFRGEELRLAGLLVPGAALGFVISRRMSHLLDRGWLRPSVLVLSAASALALLIKSL